VPFEELMDTIHCLMKKGVGEITLGKGPRKIKGVKDEYEKNYSRLT
jgi:hypothetical protein